MAYQVKRRINGAVGTPGIPGAVEGQLAVNMPGAAGTGTALVLYCYDGTAWRELKVDEAKMASLLAYNTATAYPPGAPVIYSGKLYTSNKATTGTWKPADWDEIGATQVTTQSLPLGNVPGGIGAAYTTWAAAPGNALTGSIVVGTYGTPAQAYILVNRTVPGTDASWVSLGGATPFATAGEIHTGTETAKAVSPAILRGEALDAPKGGTAGAGNADYLIRLNATGVIDPDFLPALPTNIRGAVDVTQAFAQPATGGNYAGGDMIFANKDGVIGAGWTNAAGDAVKSGDLMIFDGTKWYRVPNTTDLNAYVPLVGTNLMAGGLVWTGAAGSNAGNVVLDGKGGTVQDIAWDEGTY